MMNFKAVHNVYFLGIGGIGMSALARYFNHIGKNVAGYDRTATRLTEQLIEEGIDIHFVDDIHLIPASFLEEREETLFVYTPAIPLNMSEYKFLKQNNLKLYKRSEVLGLITEESRAIAISGTHGKTTTSTLVAHIFHSSIGCTAFLGGISSNYNSNLILDDRNDFVVVEADEFDRSFLTLFPDTAVVTAMDSDHLDVYSGKADIQQAFQKFVAQVKKGGNLIYKLGLELTIPEGINAFTYSLDNPKADFYAKDISLCENGLYRFGMHSPSMEITNAMLGIRGLVNLENAIAASAVAILNGISRSELRFALESYRGVARRFDVKILNDKVVLIDDYAHHPEEIKAFLTSVRHLFPGRKLAGVFQPHLYSRTKDFASEFAKSLELLDELVLLDIYPAREEPIEGVSAELIFKQIQLENKSLIEKAELCDFVREMDVDVLVTMGAGDIDQLIEPVSNILSGKYQLNKG